MTYGQIVDVKERLNLATADTTMDTRIERALNQTDALIDLELSVHTAVPLTTGISNVIIDIANDWATGLVQQEIINPTAQGTDRTENIFVKRAKENLEKYIEKSFASTGGGCIASTSYQTPAMQSRWDE